MKTVHALLIAAIAASSLATASAQTYGGPGFGGCRGVGCGSGYGAGSHMGYGPGSYMGFGPGHGPGPGMGYGDATVTTQARLDALRARLQLTAIQDPAWQALADAMLQQAHQTDRARDRLFESTGNAAERMTLRAELMMIEAEAFQAVAQAFSGLYEVLSADQRLVVERQWGFGMGPGWGRPAG